MRRLPLVVSLSLSLTFAACEQKPKYDDAPIAREDRKKKSAEPPETFDLEAVCAQLVDLPGPAIEPAIRPELREMCRASLASIETSRPEEYGCRCHCIKAAGDLFAVERCVRYCSADDPKRVCAHLVGVATTTNDAGAIDEERDHCVDRLKHMHDTDLRQWSCEVRCYVAASTKEDAAACDGRCSGAPGAAGGKADAGAAGVDGGTTGEMEY